MKYSKHLNYGSKLSRPQLRLSLSSVVYEYWAQCLSCVFFVRSIRSSQASTDLALLNIWDRASRCRVICVCVRHFSQLNRMEGSGCSICSLVSLECPLICYYMLRHSLLKCSRDFHCFLIDLDGLLGATGKRLASAESLFSNSAWLTNLTITL